MSHSSPWLYRFLRRQEARLGRMPGRAGRRWFRSLVIRTRVSLFSRDFLTGAYGREAFEGRAGSALARNRSGGLLLVDIDNLAWVNHAHGHQEGDECLRRAATLLRNAASSDLVARRSGNQFAIYAGSASTAGTLAEQIRVSFERDEKFNELRAKIPQRGTVEPSGYGCVGPALTATVGVATDASGESLGELLRVAEEALRCGKAAGRNRVVVG